MIKSTADNVLRAEEFLNMKILLSQAKLFFGQGLLSGWYLERVDNSVEWVIHLTFTEFGMAEAVIIDARRKEVRQQTLTSCINTLEDIGFAVNRMQNYSINNKNAPIQYKQ